MISSVFRYQANCAENLGKAYKAYKTGDITALSELSSTFAKETANGVSKICLRTFGGWLVETLAADSPIESAVNFTNMILDSKVNIATTAINGIATIATAAVSVVPSWIEKTRRRNDILRQLGSCKDPEQQKVLCEELGKLMNA